MAASVTHAKSVLIGGQIVSCFPTQVTRLHTEVSLELLTAVVTVAHGPRICLAARVGPNFDPGRAGPQALFGAAR